MLSSAYWPLCATDLQVDSKNKWRGSDDGQGLVVWGGFSVLPHCLKERSVRDEKGDERDEDAVEQADEEVLVVEQCPLLARQVELWKFQAQFVINILERKMKEEEVEGSVNRVLNDLFFFYWAEEYGID